MKKINMMLYVGAVSVLAFMLMFSEQGFLKSAYAVTFEHYNIATGAQVQQIDDILYTFNDSTGAFKKVNLDTGTTLVSTTIDIAGGFYPSFVDFRCNSANCWIMYDNSATPKFYIARISGTTGTVSQNQTYSGQTGQAQFGGLALGDTTIFFTRECATTDIGSSGAGDTDYALFSVDGNSMAGTPVQHTDCGTNFTPLSPTGRVLYMKVNTNEDRLAVIQDFASLAFKWVDLDQAFSASQNTILCTGTPTEIDMDKFNGNNIQFIDNTAYLLENSGTDDYTIDVFSSTCALTAFAGIIDEFNTSEANGLVLDSTNDVYYVGGTQADGTGLLIVARNFTSDTITNDIVAQYVPLATTTSQGFTYYSATDCATITSSTQINLACFGNPTETGGGGNQIDGRCGNGTVLDCVGTGTSPFTGITGGQNATIITAHLTNGIGITHCSTTDDSDAETCGSGLFMFAGLILLLEFLALAGYLGFTAKLHADRTIVDVALIMGIIGFVSIAIGFYLNWIPDLVFYTIIVLIAGLATFGILGKIRGSQ